MKVKLSLVSLEDQVLIYGFDVHNTNYRLRSGIDLCGKVGKILKMKQTFLETLKMQKT